MICRVLLFNKYLLIYAIFYQVNDFQIVFLRIIKRPACAAGAMNIADCDAGFFNHILVSFGDRSLVEEVGVLLFLKRIDDLVEKAFVKDTKIVVRDNKITSNTRITILHLMQHRRTGDVKVSLPAVQKHFDTHVDCADNRMFNQLFSDEVAIMGSDENRCDLSAFHILRK